MKKVIVIGCPGAGKSTFARHLHEKTRLPLYHLDLIWHKPDRTHITPQEFDQALERLLQGEQWIIDGNYGRTLEKRLQHCDTVFFLNLPVGLCLNGAESRVGIKREDMPWVEVKMDEAFREWIQTFPQNELPEIYTLLNKYKDRRIITFYSHKEIDSFLMEE